MFLQLTGRKRLEICNDKVTPWLLDGDPSIRWQVLRDVVGAAERTVERERRRVAREGGGARLLASQDPEGTSAGGLSSDGGLPPQVDFDDLHDAAASRLRAALHQQEGAEGLPAAARPADATRWRHQLRLESRSETCITGMVLSLISSFAYDDDRLDTFAEHLLAQQMPDGGWNCRRDLGATHASVHTTITVLEGLPHYEQHRQRKGSLRKNGCRHGIVPSLQAIQRIQRIGWLLGHGRCRSRRSERAAAADARRRAVKVKTCPLLTFHRIHRIGRVEC
jgi:hypothetical protein